MGTLQLVMGRKVAGMAGTSRMGGEARIAGEPMGSSVVGIIAGAARMTGTPGTAGQAGVRRLRERSFHSLRVMTSLSTWHRKGLDLGLESVRQEMR